MLTFCAKVKTWRSKDDLFVREQAKLIRAEKPKD